MTDGSNGVVLLPPGRYLTKRSLFVRAGNVVLLGRGESSVTAPTGEPDEPADFDTLVFQSASPLEVAAPTAASL